MRSPRDKTSDIQTSKPRPDKAAVCHIYHFLEFIIVRIDLTNWDQSESGCANHLEAIPKQKIGQNNVDAFTCQSISSKASRVEFHVPHGVDRTLKDGLDGAVERAVYEYSGPSKLRIRCKYPGW